ncbi:uncharacterized protein LOC130496438 [Raphanus sativus]|uniref:Uncharacterized protein LOC130496438 n=1 Tax=Raphanus sativus TaxID=3726 RepID=A0A9W3BZ30_RAPSA|nr:uncharacterized protein LOC130496438 [Raphanus sativus]
MEHLAVHLPYEALLRGPVHYGWMYQYERAMKYLKGKAKNLAKVEGSIIAGSLTEETSHFTSYYFASKVRTRKRAPRRYYDGGVAPTYAVAGVPDIFSQIGRLGGKSKEVWWSSEEDAHSAHTYILLNCEDPLIRYFESLFVSQVEETFPGISTTDVDKRKDQHFIKWLKSQVDFDDDADYPKWLHEVIQSPHVKVTTSQMYFTRGYTFHTYEYGRQRATSNYGICVKGETDFYGILTEIIEVEFPGILKLKCVLFKCEWFDPVVNRGVRFNKFGVVDVNGGRRYNKFEPFILASQADQVSYLPYPRMRESGINWLSVIKVTPRGRIISGEEPPLQEEQINEVEEPEQQIDDILLIDPHNHEYEDLTDDGTDEAVEDEFNENDDVSSDDENVSD